MGELVDFPSNGTQGQGYLATPAASGGPAVIVIQEWWGLVDHIKDVCDRFAAEGFTALAPDLYRGEATTEPDEAAKKMMALNLGTAAKDMSGAIDYLKERSGQSHVGVVGFCMGGGLALVLACQRADAVKAVAPFYGVIAWPEALPDYSALGAAVQGHYAENDGFASPETVHALERQLRDLGKEVEMFIYPGTDHAFFNDTRSEVHDPGAASQAWGRVVDFLRTRLG